MRLRTSTAAALVLAAGLSAAGCASSSPATAPAANTQSTTQTGSAAPTESTSQGTNAAGSGNTCQAGGLSFALGANAGNSSQHTQVVDLTNTTSAACTMAGFPGVDLIGAANGQQNFSWSLQRSSTKYSQVTLPPGGSAHFNVTYLPGTADSSGDITVFKLELTPPNSFTQAEVTWNQSVLLQDGATHPGTYISPILSGA
jgi:hypothetical protein